jgi:hypothetical protein
VYVASKISEWDSASNSFDKKNQCSSWTREYFPHIFMEYVTYIAHYGRDFQNSSKDLQISNFWVRSFVLGPQITKNRNAVRFVPRLNSLDKFLKGFGYKK